MVDLFLDINFSSNEYQDNPVTAHVKDLGKMLPSLRYGYDG